MNGIFNLKFLAGVHLSLAENKIIEHSVETKVIDLLSHHKSKVRLFNCCRFISEKHSAFISKLLIDHNLIKNYVTQSVHFFFFLQLANVIRRGQSKYK